MSFSSLPSVLDVKSAVLHSGPTCYLTSDGEKDESDGEEDDDGEDDDAMELAPDTTMRDGFLDFCDTDSSKFEPLDEARKKSTRLMELMRKAKCPLNAYQPFLEWHLMETGHLSSRMTLKDTTEYFTRPTTMNHLFK